MKMIRVKLDSIHQGEKSENSRITYKEGEIIGLMESIKQTGDLLQPIGVKEESNGEYRLIFGNKRLTAYERLGRKDIPAVLCEGIETEADFIVWNLIENLQRSDLSAVEEGRYFFTLMDSFKLSESEIAARLSLATSRVRNSITIFKNLPEQFRTSVVNNRSGGQKKGLISGRIAVKVLNEARKCELSGDQVEELLEFAKQDQVGDDQIRAVSGLMASGAGVEEAIGMAAQTKRVSVNILMNKRTIDRLERKYSKPIGIIAYEKLITDKELKAVTFHREKGAGLPHWNNSSRLVKMAAKRRGRPTKKKQYSRSSLQVA